MTVSPTSPEPASDAPIASPLPAGMPTPEGIYALPVVGPQLQRVRTIADGLQPTEADSVARVAAKRVVQGSVIAGSAVVAIAVL